MPWSFEVVGRLFNESDALPTTVYLVRDGWNDFGYETTFHVHVPSREDGLINVGIVKIARAGARATEDNWPVVTDLPDRFARLSAEHFSVGQDSKYYRNWIEAVGPTTARSLLQALGDLAVTPSRLPEVIGLDVASKSLFRYMPPSTVRDQFVRVLEGGDERESFELRHQLDVDDSRSLVFKVVPGSQPPTNVHALIGSNGAGKTRALRSLLSEFEAIGGVRDDWRNIANLVSVSFSAFDPFPEVIRVSSAQALTRVMHIGLASSFGRDQPIRTEQLSDAFRTVVAQCTGGRVEVLREVLSYLAADPLLGSLALTRDVGSDAWLTRVAFDQRSSGHKIVLLTLVNLVRWTNEKSLVLLDEPEAHLHPPLLSALIRATSALLNRVNGLAVIATHSPVVIQELPRSCVSVLWNVGDGTRVSAAPVETFGESIAVLTREVFHYEIDKTGFHLILEDVADASRDMDEAVESLGGQLGDEARAILRGMLRRRGRSVD